MRRLLHTITIIASGTLATPLLVACGASDAAGTDVPRTSAESRANVDPAAGSYRGVGLGDTKKRVAQALGTPQTRQDGGFIPIGESVDTFEGPPILVLAPPHATNPPPLDAYRYRGAVFIFYGSEVGAVTITDPHASTPDGLAIGDPLKRATAIYPGMECYTANEGSEYRPFRACTGEVAPGRFVWFGGDPISTITLSQQPIG